MKHPCFRYDLMTPTAAPPPSLSALTLPLLLHPLPDEAVGEGVFWRKPDDGGVASPGRSFHLEGTGDFVHGEPASIFQL